MTKTMTKTMTTVPVTLEIPEQRLRDMLVSAFEGGSTYWCVIEKYQFAKGVSHSDFKEGGRFTDPDNYHHPSQLIPFHPGCAVVISVSGDEDQEGKTFNLDREALERGIQLLAESKQCPPRHFAAFQSENDDAETADVYLQLCLFGDIVYG